MTPQAFQQAVLTLYYVAIEQGDICLARTCRSALRGASDCIAEVRSLLSEQS
jgi:hypothetical protein